MKRQRSPCPEQQQQTQPDLSFRLDGITSTSTYDLFNWLRAHSKDHGQIPPPEPVPQLPVFTDDLFDRLQANYEDNSILPPKPLPQLPVFTPSLNMGKKRDHEEWLASSSDAPVFSSDDLPSSSAENYLDHRQKRQHSRRWFDNEEIDMNCITSSPRVRTPREKGPFKRNFESAVWLGSDESSACEDLEADLQDAGSKASRVITFGGSTDDEDFSFDDLDCDEPQQSADYAFRSLRDKAMQHVDDPGEFTGPIYPYWQQQPEPHELKQFHERQQNAWDKVMECEDRGDEVLDLSSMNLKQIRAQVLRPLRTLVKQHAEDINGDSSQLSPLTPSLRIYLSNNSLGEIPNELYQIDNITVLSLRSNNIREILPSIDVLTRLCELNLASNQLRYLPFEMLDMKQLKHCTVFPNPFLRPFPSTSPSHMISTPNRISKPNRYASNMSRLEPDRIALTPVAFLDILGKSHRSWTPAPSSVTEYWLEPAGYSTTSVISDGSEEESITSGSSDGTSMGSDGWKTWMLPNINGDQPKEFNRAPSLLEIALRGCYKAPNTNQLPFLLPNDCPPHLVELLKRTCNLKEAGGQFCTVCKSEYIVPRTEWIEWWHIFSSWSNGRTYDDSTIINTGPVPFLRRGCSWGCTLRYGDDSDMTGWRSSPTTKS